MRLSVIQTGGIRIIEAYVRRGSTVYVTLYKSATVKSRFYSITRNTFFTADSSEHR